jgi:uncharacterized repeat protein (TIGR03806 family)
MVSCEAAFADPYLPSVDGEVAIEAEHFDGNLQQGGHGWIETLTPGFVGDSAMQSSPDSGTVRNDTIAVESPRLDYEVDFSSAANLNVWIRGMGPNWNADSIWVGIDGNAAGAVRVTLPKNNLDWARLRGQLIVSPGVHTINIWMREDGSIVDRVFLTPLSTTPTGDGPAESSRSGGSPGNTWPIAVDDAFVVAEDSLANSLPVLADNGGGVDFDPDGDPITVISVVSPGSAGGAVSVNATSDGLDYTPATDYAGTETFLYTINDDQGGNASATVTVTVNNTNNDSPELAAIGNRTATAGQALFFSLAATDVDGPPTPAITADLTALSGTPSFIDHGNGTADFSWTPAESDAPGNYSVTFAAVDAVDSALTSSETISISVQAATGGTGPYLADSIGQVIMEAEHFDLNESHSNRDWIPDFTPGYVGDSAMLSDPDSWLAINSNIGVSSPRMDYEVEFAAAATLNVWVRGRGASGSADSIWIGVDGDDTTAQRVNPPQGAWGWDRASVSISVSGGLHTINVWMREDGTIVDRLFLTPLAIEPTGDGPAESVRGGGAPSNTWPIAKDDSFVVDLDSINNSLMVLADNGNGPDFDPDGHPINITSVDNPGSAGGTIIVNASSDGLVYTPFTGYIGSETFNYTISDGFGGTSTGAVTVDVQDSSSGGSGAYLPDSSGQVVIEAEHYDLKFSQSGRDWLPDFSAGYVGSSAMLSAPNSWLSINSNIDANSPRMDYQVDVASAANFNIWIRGLGPSGSADSVWVGVDGDDSTVRRVNLTRGDWGWTTASEQLSIPAGIHTVNIWMREDGSIVDRLVLTPQSAAPSGNGPPESSRDNGSSGNQVPIAVNDIFAVVEDSTANALAVLANNGGGSPDYDPDGDPITITSVVSPASNGGSVSINGTSDGLIYTPVAGFVGPELFDYTISDSAGSSATATVTVNVYSNEPSTLGLDVRPNNLTCVAPPRPTADASISVVDAFPTLPDISLPTKMILEPVANPRWFVLRKSGELETFDPDSATSLTRYLDLSGVVRTVSEGGLLGLAFHPDYPNTPEIFLSYTEEHTGPNMRSVISRFILDDIANPGAGTVEQEILLIDQDGDSHNGGDIAFGADGYLYIGLGDGGGAGDTRNRSQDTTRLLGSMLRIDVTGPGVSFPGNPYNIPTDNPFEGNAKCGPAANVDDCPEIYAWGFRNPWRWSFDPPTGDLWLGDVGQGTWEEVDVVELGGNYGWRCREGAHDYNTDGCDSGYTDPVFDYPRTEGQSITGGFVYRGSAIPALIGKYVFADYREGRIWALQSDGQGGYTSDLLIDAEIGPTSFGVGPDGELYFTDINNSRLRKIEPAGAGTPDTIPQLLSATGCTDPGDVTQPYAGLVPYDINALFWSDGAVKDRLIGIPNGTTITIDAANDWEFPNGTVIVKNFRLDGNLIETRHLMRHPDGIWAGYTYEWNAAQTEATRIQGGKVVNIAGQDWIYPSESQCMNCHTNAAGFALGPETAQLNMEFAYPSTGRTANQLETLDHVMMFTSPLPGPAIGLPALADPADTSASLNDRARAYLHTNCAQCHQPGGQTPSEMDWRYTTALSNTNACDAVPLEGDLGIANARLIAPGDSSRSIIIERATRRDSHGMPPLGSNLIDTVGTTLLTDWVNSLSTCN